MTKQLLSIAAFLDSGHDVNELHDLDDLIAETVFAEAAGLFSHHREVAQTMYDDLAKGSAALPPDLLDSNEDRERLAVELCDHYRPVLDLLEDADLRQRFAAAIPADRLERELVQAADYKRRDQALATIESLANDSGVSTDDLETVADLIRRVTEAV